VFDLPDNGGAVLRYTIPLGQLTAIGEPMQMKWNRDGSRLYILDFDYLLHIVNGADGSVMESLCVDYGFDISPDGDYIAYDSGTELVVRRWQNGASVVLYTLPVTVRSLQIVQNGSALAVLEENRVALYDLPTGQLMRFLPVFSPQPSRATFSEDGQLILLHYEDWSRRTHAIVVSWSGNFVDSWVEPEKPQWVAFSPDGRYLATDRHGLEMRRGYSSLHSYERTFVLAGWMGLAPEHLRYTWRRISTGEVLDKGSARITSGEAPVYRFRVPHPDPFSADLSLTVEGPPFLRVEWV
jgi:WD40 repeat protein